MLPNDDFKAEVVSGRPLGFMLPGKHTGLTIRTNAAYGLIEVADKLIVDKSGFSIDTVYKNISVFLTQSTVYNFGIAYNVNKENYRFKEKTTNLS